MPNRELDPKPNVSAFRRIAIGTWQDAYDPQVYGALTVRMEEALRYVEAFRAKTGRRLTVTHLVGKAVARALAETPDANAILRFNRPYLRRRVNVFFSVAMEDPATGEVDLSGVRVEDVDTKSLEALVAEFEPRVRDVRSGADKTLEKTRGAFGAIPFPLLNGVLKGLSFLTGTLNLDLSALGVPPDPFGSVIITNIGSLGLDEAYPPLIPHSRVPLLISVGAVRDQPVVEGGVIVPAKTLRLTATFDHRLLDGKHAQRLARSLSAALERPFEHFDGC